MACVLTQDFTKDCRDSRGGLQKIYITEIGNKNTLSPASGKITTFTLTTGKQFWIYAIDRQAEAADFTDKQTGNDANGSLMNEQSLNMVLHKMQQSLRDEIRLLAKNDLMIIVLDENGTYWLLGENRGMRLNDSTATTGKSMGDLNGYTMVFTGKEPEAAREVDSALIAVLTAPAV